MTILFIDVDTQFDFCDPKGSLYVKGSDNSVIPVVSILNSLADHSDKYELIGCVDTHVTNDPEFKEWPVHCVKGTQGWLKHPNTLPNNFIFVPQDATSIFNDQSISDQKISPLAPYFEKNGYSLLSNPLAEKWLTARADDFPRIAVYGLALDYCVKATALGLRKLFPGKRIDVINTACQAVNPDNVVEVVRTLCNEGIGYIDHVTLVTDP